MFPLIKLICGFNYGLFTIVHFVVKTKLISTKSTRRGDRVYFATRLSWHNVNISPRVCKSATPVGQYEELHLSLEGS
jgi:hypothetical protein